MGYPGLAGIGSDREVRIGSSSHNITLWLGATALKLRARLAVLEFEAAVEILPYVDIAAVRARNTSAVLVLDPAEARDAMALPEAERVHFRVVLHCSAKQQAGAAQLAHPLLAALVHDSALLHSLDELVLAINVALRMLDHEADAARTTRRMQQLLEIGRALAAEKDLDTLFDLILTHARTLTGADGASIYTRDARGSLYFRLWQNASVTTRADAQKTLVGEYSVAGFVARTAKIVNLEDAYAIPAEAPYTFNPASDAALKYRTRSMLTLPLVNKAGEVLGVLQLINRLQAQQDEPVPFDEADLEVARSLAGQAGVALENSSLYHDIEQLLEGFINASVRAIEARDPVTAGHAFRVADYTERLSMAVDRVDTGAHRALRFGREALRELRYAALLHDFGKVGVRESVLTKANKLHVHELALIEQRFITARASLARSAWASLLGRIERGEIAAAELGAARLEIEHELGMQRQRLDAYLEAVRAANRPHVAAGKQDDDINALLDALAAFRFPGEEGDASLLTPFEFSLLGLGRGSLSEDERREIESHVSHSFEFLRLIPWTRDLARLPEIAHAHHEKLDGSGYPRGLVADEIPVEARIMTICDIYDALTAPDRPYKPALTKTHALDILTEESRAGKIDATLLDIFIEARAYERS